MSNNQVERLTIEKLCNKNEKYIIPIYQRNYTWGKDEIELLIQDVLEALNKNESKNYYIGSLVVSKRKDGYEVIDGQQRLTTLKLLLSYYNKKENIHLDFEHRNESNDSFKNLHSKQSQKNAIEQGFQIIKNYNELAENDKKQKFFDFLLERVVILRTEVPEDTDLNHYFEIMNNRGEQLEKHEVLKARLMDKLQKNERALFSLIWDACSDMNVYAIKRFPYSNDDSKSIRTNENFFGEFCHLIPSDFEKMLSNFNIDSYTSASGSILDLLSSYKIENKKEVSNQNDDEIRDGSFNSIIDFPNFLMIALKIFKGDEKVELNDKYLLDNFDKGIKAQEDIKIFIVKLLKYRLLFDRYIIKTKAGEDDWVLYALKKYKDGNFKEINSFSTDFRKENGESNNQPADDKEEYKIGKYNQHIIHILSMFHISFRTKIYKNWLFEVLRELDKKLSNNYELKDNDYLNILEDIAYQQYKRSKDKNVNFDNAQSTPHYIFNYLDYLLWKNWDKYLDKKENIFIEKNQFRFSLSRTSIEHYLAQNLAPEGSKVHNFGNLCLISPHQNSALSDYETTTKRSFYEGASKRFDCMSLKQAIMLSKENWTEKDIEKHCEDMKNILDTEPSQNK
ncbi:MAG: DUF262 domain-containing protein [Lonepinella koalarum]|nr:DUF262 domain-containing protein [Lonepinella koalarum]